MHMIRSFLWHQDTCKELGRTKLNVQIRDDTVSVDATIFTEKAEALYDMTATELAQHTSTGNLPISLIEKLSAPKKHNISLKASMYDYGGINRCVFNIDSVSEPINAEELLQIEPSQEQQSQPQPPKTPSKCAQGEGSKVSSTTYCTEMEDDEFEPATETQAEKRVIPMSNASKLSWENRHSANLLCE